MQKSKIPGTMPDPERLYVMLENVPREFTSGQAFEAAKAEGYEETSERTLRKDLNKAAEAGILEDLSHGKWELLEAGTTELRTRIGLSLLSATVSYEKHDVTYETSIKGPSPDELRDAIDRYAPLFDDL
jgi:repressor of nif and glnA expression